MRQALLQLAGLIAISSAVLHPQTSAQPILGTWQATFPTLDNQRVALKIARTPDGILRATRYQVDKNPEGMPLTTVTFTPPDLTIEHLYANYSFRGKLSPDGKSLTGTWTQEKDSYPVTFLLATPDTLWRTGAAAPLPFMSATADPAFEVATIKPSPPDAKGFSRGLRTRQFTVRNQSVKELIKFAYNIRDRQIQGDPAWLAIDKFDIAAEPDAPGQPKVDQYRLMLKKLLAERFNLTIHTIQPIATVYALTWDKAASPLPLSDPEFDDRASIYVKSATNGQTLLDFLGHTMATFVDLLMNFVPDRQIVDETGLTGHYEFTLTVPSTMLQADASEDEKAADLIHAIQPLGFHLVTKKAPLPTLVIDHIDKPTAN